MRKPPKFKIGQVVSVKSFYGHFEKGENDLRAITKREFS